MKKLRLDITGWTCTISKEAEIKKGQGGGQKMDPTGRPMWTTQLVALEPGEGATVLDITTAGERPNLMVGQLVTPVQLQAVPWLKGGRKNRDGTDEPIVLELAYRASEISAVALDGKKSPTPVSA